MSTKGRENMSSAKRILSSGFLGILAMMANLFANSACHGRLYEEELPEELRK